MGVGVGRGEPEQCFSQRRRHLVMFELVRQLETPNRKVGLPETTSMTSGGQNLAQNPALYSGFNK